MSLDIIELPSCASTSAELAAMTDAPQGTVVLTHCQTAGRGQRGNSWEAEPDKNLTFSMLLRPQGWLPARQFELSMLIALAVADAIDAVFRANGCDERTSVKWPNDIYVGHKKICGILIECKLCGAALERCIAGIGVDVNQRRFLSDAPNPVSIVHFVGHDTPLRPLLVDICTRIEAYCSQYIAAPAPHDLHSRYMRRLYRGDGNAYPFREPGGPGFMAAIVDVALSGHISLSNGKTYAFKEIEYIHTAES